MSNEVPSLRDLVTLDILHHLRTGKENETNKKKKLRFEMRDAMRAAILASDDYNTIKNILSEGVKRKRNNGIIHKKSLKPVKTRKKFREGASAQNTYIVQIPENELYNKSMPRSNVQESKVSKASAEAYWRRYGGYHKMRTTNGQGFVYVPNAYSVRNNGKINRYISMYQPNTTAETLRVVPGASINKPPPRRVRPWSPSDSLRSYGT